MNRNILVQIYKNWLARALQVQLFMCLVSIPFLIYVGLPVSILSPLSTIIFGPFLTIFLLLSSLIFFAELFYIPNTLLIWCLEKTTNIWLFVLAYSHQSWLIGFAIPSVIILILIPIFVLLSIHCKYTSTPVRTIALFSFILLFIMLASKVNTKSTIIRKIECHGNFVHIIHDNKTNILIDSGVIATRPSAQTWVKYTLIPQIIKQTGSLVLDHVIVLQPSMRLFEALTLLCSQIHIKNIYMPKWRGLLPKKVWFTFIQLRKTLENNGGIINFIQTNTISIRLSQSNVLNLDPCRKQLRYFTCTYPIIHVNGQIDNHLFSLYAAKYKKSNKENKKS